MLFLDVVLLLLERLLEDRSAEEGGSLEVVEDDGSVMESVSICMSCVAGVVVDVPGVEGGMSTIRTDDKDGEEADLFERV